VDVASEAQEIYRSHDLWWSIHFPTQWPTLQNRHPESHCRVLWLAYRDWQRYPSTAGRAEG